MEKAYVYINGRRRTYRIRRNFVRRVKIGGRQYELMAGQELHLKQEPNYGFRVALIGALIAAVLVTGWGFAAYRGLAHAFAFV